MVLKRILSLVKIELLVMNMYRSSIFIWMLNGLLPFISMFIWLNVKNDPTSQKDILVYFLSVFITTQLIATSTFRTLDFDIRRGSFTMKLLRPMNPIYWYLGSNLSLTIFSIPMILIPTVILFAIQEVNLLRLPLFISSLFFAWIIHFLRQYFMGLLSFWTDRTESLSNLWESVNLIFSGIFIPIFFMPESVQKFIFYLPFPYTVFVPSRIMSSNNINVNTLAQYMIGQISWVLIFLLITYFIWKKGIKKYGAVGN